MVKFSSILDLLQWQREAGLKLLQVAGGGGGKKKKREFRMLLTVGAVFDSIELAGHGLVPDPNFVTAYTWRESSLKKRD